MRLPLPYGGLHNGESRADQPLGTSSDVSNVWPLNAANGRQGLCQRPGSGKYVSTVTGAAKAKAIVQLPDASQNATYTSLGDSVTTEWSKRLGDAKAVATDRQGNVVALNGRVGLVRVNPSSTTLSTISLPTTDTGHEARALAVDDEGRIYVGISTGGQQSTATMWCYAPAADDKLTLVWDMTLGVYVEQIKIKNGKLYTLQNNPERGSAEVVIYENFTVADPTETQRFVTAGNANDMDAAADFVVVAAGPDSQRGLDPLARDASPRASDWNPTMLTKWGERAWAWVDASDSDTLIIEAISGAPDDDGGQVLTWIDKTGNGRHLYGAGSLSIASRTNPTYRARGSSGLPSVFFNGTSSKMISGTNANTTDQFQQASFVPGYAGAMYVICGVVKMTTGVTDRRWCFGIQTAGGSQKFFLNVDAGSGFPAAADTGSCAWYESQATTSASGVGTKPNNYPFTSLHPWNPVSPSGTRNLQNGFIVFSIAFTNGQTGFESWARINGNPVDVWTSTADTWTDGFQLGEVTTVSTGTTKDPSGSYDFFPGEVMEMLVLRDYYSSGSLALIEVNGTGGNVFPNANPSAVPNQENTEIQKIEGYLAHKWGCSHVFPTGTAARLDFSGNAVAGETVTIGSTTYTWRAAPALANEVLVGANASASALNLIRAVNLSGTAGTHYGATTALNASMWAFPQRFNEDADTTPSIIFRSLTQSGTAITTTETMTNAAFTAATSQATLNPDTLGENTGHYPQPFTTYRVLNGSSQIISTGGPPRQNASDYALPSKAGLLNSPYGLLVKHADSGRPKWVATSGVTSPTTGLGGVGYGCVVLSDGLSIVSCGPRHTTIGTDNIDVRKIIDQGDTYNTTNNTGATDAWSDNPGAFTYAYPRMAVDKFDNVYVPSFISGTSLLVYAKLGVSSASPDNANEIATVTNITGDPTAYAVAVHPTVPDYPASFTDDRAQYVYLGTAPTSTLALYKLGLVSVANATGTPNAYVNLVVNGADIKTFTTSAVSSTLGSVLDATAQTVSTFVGYRKAFFVDGRKPHYYDAATTTVSEWVATSGGEIDKSFRLGCFWRGRAFLARGNNPSQWACSAVGDPFDWDMFPAVFTFSSAVSGTTGLAGQPSDVINSLHAVGDDYLIIGGSHSIRRFAGDPANPTSQIQLVTDKVGTTFGPCWARDDVGVDYFVGSDLNVYEMLGTAIRPLTLGDSNIHEALRAIDLSAYYLRLVFDTRYQMLRLNVEPYGAGGVSVAVHYVWHKPSRSWWPVSKAAAGTQWTCCAVLDSDTGRTLVYGREDGYIEKEDATAKTDDGVRMETRCLIGPIVPETEEHEARTTALQAVLDGQSDGCYFQLSTSGIPNLPTVPNVTGTLRPGFNNVAARMCGSYIWIMLRSLSVGTAAGATRWCCEALHLDINRAGRKRHAPVR